jgi:hypothetical protein
MRTRAIDPVLSVIPRLGSTSTRSARKQKIADAANLLRLVVSRGLRLTALIDGGGRGIRTPGTVSRTAVFKTARFNHSRIPPSGRDESCSLTIVYIREVSSHDAGKRAWSHGRGVYRLRRQELCSRLELSGARLEKRTTNQGPHSARFGLLRASPGLRGSSGLPTTFFARADKVY